MEDQHVLDPEQLCMQDTHGSSNPTADALEKQLMGPALVLDVSSFTRSNNPSILSSWNDAAPHVPKQALGTAKAGWATFIPASSTSSLPTKLYGDVFAANPEAPSARYRIVSARHVGSRTPYRMADCLRNSRAPNSLIPCREPGLQGLKVRVWGLRGFGFQGLRFEGLGA